MEAILEAKKYSAMSEKELLAEAERLSQHEDKTVAGFGRTVKKCILNKFIDINEFFSAVNTVLFVGGPALSICIGVIIGVTLLITTLVPFVVIAAALNAQEKFLKTRLKWTDPNALKYRELSKEIRKRHIRVTTEGVEVVNEKVVTGTDLTTVNIDGDRFVSAGMLRYNDDAVSIPGQSYDDLLAHQVSVYNDGEMLKIINSDDIVKMYNDYAEMNIDRILHLLEVYDSQNTIDLKSAYTVLDRQIAEECKAILTENVMTKNELKTYMTKRYFDATDDPVVLRRTLKLRYNWNRRVTDLIKSMLLNNYQLLGYTEEEAKKMVDNLSNDNKRDTVEAVFDKIVADNHMMNGSECDLRKYGMGVIYCSDELVREFQEETGLLMDAVIQASRYDAVILAHGSSYSVTTSDGREIYKKDIINQYDWTDGDLPEDIRDRYDDVKRKCEKLNTTIEDVRDRYDFLSWMFTYHKDGEYGFMPYNVLANLSSPLPFDVHESIMTNIKELEGDYLKRFKRPLCAGDFKRECEVLSSIHYDLDNIDYWKKNNTWIAQSTKIGENQNTENVAKMITNVLNTQNPKPRTIMVMTCNPESIKLPQSFMTRKDVVIHVANYSNAVVHTTKQELKNRAAKYGKDTKILEIYNGLLESVDYTYEMDEIDSALYETEQYLMGFSKDVGVDYNDNDILIESVYDVIIEGDIVVEGVISTVWKALINFIKKVLSALIALFKAVINFFKRIFNLIRNIFRALVGKPPVPYDISYIAMEGAEVDTFKPRTNKDIEDKLKKSCEKMGKELQQLSKIQTKITQEIKKEAERKAKEDAEAANEAIGIPYFDGHHWTIITEAPKEEIVPDDTNDYTDDVDEDDENTPEEEPEDTEEPTDDGGDEPVDDTEPVTTDYTEDEDLAGDTGEEDTTGDNDTTAEDEPLDPNAEDDTATDDTTEEDPEADTTEDDMTDDTNDYTEDEGMDGGEDTGDTTDDTVDDTTTDDMGGQDEEQSQNSIVKNYNLMIDFKRLYTTTSDILSRLGDVVFKNPIQNQVLDRCVQNIQKISEQVLNYMEFTFSTKYEDNLYHYNIFVQALKLNLEIMKKNNQLGDIDENS